MRDAYSHCTRLLHQNKQIYFISLPASPIRLPFAPIAGDFSGGVSGGATKDKSERQPKELLLSSKSLCLIRLQLAVRLQRRCHMWRAGCKLLSSAGLLL